MFKDKYPYIFSRQTAAIVYLLFTCSLKDVPREILGSTGPPLTNQSDAKSGEAGLYLFPSLHFLSRTRVEAWEVHAEKPGLIQLQVSSQSVFNAFLL